MMRKGFSRQILKFRVLASFLHTFIIIMPCIYDYTIIMHNWVTFTDDKTINYFLWLLLLIIHLCKVGYGLQGLEWIGMVGSYQCYHMAERS